MLGYGHLFWFGNDQKDMAARYSLLAQRLDTPIFPYIQRVNWNHWYQLFVILTKLIYATKMKQISNLSWYTQHILKTNNKDLKVIKWQKPLWDSLKKKYNAVLAVCRPHKWLLFFIRVCNACLVLATKYSYILHHNILPCNVKKSHFKWSILCDMKGQAISCKQSGRIPLFLKYSEFLRIQIPHFTGSFIWQ